MAKATGPAYKVAFRRRRKGLTNYAKRLALVKGMAPRMVVRSSSKGILVQFVEFSKQGDKVIAAAGSKSLKQHGWQPRCNSPTAYLCGLLAGKSAAKKGVKNFNLDMGMQKPSKGSIAFAALRGAIDSGLKTNYSEGMIADERITGAAIEKYAKALKQSDENKYSKIFSSYIKEGFDPGKMVEKFNSVKEKIIG